MAPNSGHDKINKYQLIMNGRFGVVLTVNTECRVQLAPKIAFVYLCRCSSSCCYCCCFYRLLAETTCM